MIQLTMMLDQSIIILLIIEITVSVIFQLFCLDLVRELLQLCQAEEIRVFNIRMASQKLIFIIKAAQFTQ